MDIFLYYFNTEFPYKKVKSRQLINTRWLTNEINHSDARNIRVNEVQVLFYKNRTWCATRISTWSISVFIIWVIQKDGLKEPVPLVGGMA